MPEWLDLGHDACPKKVIFFACLMFFFFFFGNRNVQKSSRLMNADLFPQLPPLSLSSPPLASMSKQKNVWVGKQREREREERMVEKWATFSTSDAFYQAVVQAQPTTHSHKNFRLSSYAEILLISTDWAYRYCSRKRCLAATTERDAFLPKKKKLAALTEKRQLFFQTINPQKNIYKGKIGEV